MLKKMDDEKKSYEQLRQELADAAEKINVGDTYGHYKHPEKPYRVKGFCILEANDEVAVMYEPLDQPGIVFARPVNVWLETVEWEGKTAPRFSKLTK